MSIEGGGLPSCPQQQPPSFPCHPSEPACTISTGISDQTSKQVLHDHEPLLVGSSLDQHAKIEQPHKDLQQSINGECIDEQGKMYCIEDLSVQDYGRTGVKEGFHKKGSCTWQGSSSGPVVTPMVSFPSASNRPRKKLLQLWRIELDKEEEEEKEKKTEKQRKFVGDLKQGNAVKNSNVKKTRSINSILDGQDVLIPITDDVKGRKDVFKVGTIEKDGKLNMGSKPEAISRSRNFKLTIEYEAKEIGKRGRPKKVKESSSFGNSRSPGEQKPKRGRPKKVKDQIFNATNEAPTRKRGRPKKVKESADKKEKGNKQELKKETSKVALEPINENENGGEQRRKRGRPKKVKDQLVNWNEDKKRKGRTTKKVKDQLINDKTEEKTKKKRGRPKKLKNQQQLDSDMRVETLKPTKKKKRYYNYSKCRYIFG